MSSINGISQRGSEQAQAAQQQQLKANTPKTANAAAASALQEANETAAETRQEAAKGDQVAIRRLAKQHKPGNASQPQPQQPTPNTVSGAAQSRTTSGGFHVTA